MTSVKTVQDIFNIQKETSAKLDTPLKYGHLSVIRPLPNEELQKFERLYNAKSS